jgi:hypothetical protein
MIKQQKHITPKMNGKEKEKKYSLTPKFTNDKKCFEV